MPVLPEFKNTTPIAPVFSFISQGTCIDNGKSDELFKQGDPLDSSGYKEASRGLFSAKMGVSVVDLTAEFLKLPSHMKPYSSVASIGSVSVTQG